MKKTRSKKPKTLKWVVMYCDYPAMRERWFDADQEQEAIAFAKEKGTVPCDIYV